jgi:hypothetical protein
MSTIKGYKPHSTQRLIHNSINNEPFKYYVLNIGRQFGKSMLGINQMLYWSINHKGCNIAWVTPVYKQSKKVFSDFEKYTQNSGIFSYNKSELLIQGLGSTIQFFSGERPDNIRGNTFDFLIVDEMAFTRRELWDEVLSATVLVKGKKVLFISTPKGKNHFHSLFMQCNYDDRYKSFSFTSYDNPMIDPREIDERKRSLPDHVFKQEYLAEFIDGGTGIFRNVRECIGVGVSGKNYGGLDIGRADDYTVLTVINERKEMVFCERWRQTEWSTIIDKVAEKIVKYNCMTAVEVNNQGDVFYELLEKKCRNLVYPHVTSSSSKPIMIEDLAVAFENKEIKVLNIDWLIDELENFTYIYNPNTRKVQYSAPQGMHDDSVISLSLANQSHKTKRTKGQYYIARI